MSLGPQMDYIRVNNRKGVIFNTGSMCSLPLKINILKSGFPYAREDQKIGTGPDFHESRSSKGYN